jgi:hypothetical protein
MADIQPYPPRGTAKAIRQVQRQLCCFEYLAPQFRNLHPLEATSPQECSEIAAHAFRSLRFDTTYRLPSYRRWLEADLAATAHARYRLVRNSSGLCCFASWTVNG